MTKNTDASSILASMRKSNAGAAYRVRNALRVNPHSGIARTDTAGSNKTQRILRTISQ